MQDVCIKKGSTVLIDDVVEFWPPSYLEYKGDPKNEERKTYFKNLRKTHIEMRFLIGTVFKNRRNKIKGLVIDEKGVYHARIIQCWHDDLVFFDKEGQPIKKRKSESNLTHWED